MGTGYNGFPRGVADHADRYEHRPTKLLMTVHAELNAILNASASVEGCILFCTHAPCAGCAAAIIQSGIVAVVSPSVDPEFRSRWAEQYDAMEVMLGEAGVQWVTYDGP